MTLVPWKAKSQWDSVSELEYIQRELNRLVNFPLSKWPTKTDNFMKGLSGLAIDIVDSKDNILVKADIPGINKEDLEVAIEGDTLIIKGEKKQESEIKEKDYIRSERSYGSFNRAVLLPSEVDVSKISANYKNGVLELTLPKKEGAKPKSIKVDIK